ncbi:uncharacterized protein METZ01_LOCUS502451 [marine metagenome]|uniref:Uncharacterized protein n=1 Tax=marine metagenome TaxID=408172 RepID=A0A383DYG3_9ZZZZ
MHLLIAIIANLVNQVKQNVFID